MEEKSSLSISTVVDVGNDAFKDGKKAGQQAKQDEVDILYTMLTAKDVAITDLKSLLELCKDYAKKEKQAGIKEVIEWIKSNRETPLGTDRYGFYIWDSKLQAKIKEWGL